MRYTFLILATFLFISCESDEPSDLLTISQCVDDEISVFESRACRGSGDLTKWTFDGIDVFCFNEGDCLSDSQALIYDADCNLICTLGGITGNENCDGLDWTQNATFIGTIYNY